MWYKRFKSFFGGGLDVVVRNCDPNLGAKGEGLLWVSNLANMV